MENPITQLEQLTLTSQAKIFLKETASWARFLSIIGFIGIGIMIVLALFATTIFNNLPNMQTVPFNLGIAMTITYFVFAIIYFFPVYYLFQFSKKMQKALSTKNNDTLSDAFEILKSHYKFIGVFTIIILSLYVLMFLVSMLGFLG